jgi:hypothetical protein
MQGTAIGIHAARLDGKANFAERIFAEAWQIVIASAGVPEEIYTWRSIERTPANGLFNLSAMAGYRRRAGACPQRHRSKYRAGRRRFLAPVTGRDPTAPQLP